MYTAVQAIKDGTGSIQNAHELQQHHAMLEWLSPTQYAAQMYDVIARRQERTGEWFLDSVEFKRWKEGTDKTLFCPGIPGAGKTMLAAIAIDRLSRIAGRDNIGLAYVFCNYKAQNNQTASRLLAALLKQLVQFRPEVAAPVVRMYGEHLDGKSKPTLGDIFEALRSVCSNYPIVYIVVDALDECADDVTRASLIKKIFELQDKNDVRLLLTSRFIPEVMQRFQAYSKLEVRATKDDVSQFIAGQIARLPKCIQRSDELQHTVINKIVEAVDGM